MRGLCDAMAKCFACDVDTPLALRLPGILSDLPEGKRGRLPYCADHEREALARRDAAIGVRRGDNPPARDPPAQPQPSGRGAVCRPPHANDPAQGTLI